MTDFADDLHEPTDTVDEASRPDEATAVALLAAEAPRHDFPLWASALTFPEIDRPGRLVMPKAVSLAPSLRSSPNSLVSVGFAPG